MKQQNINVIYFLSNISFYFCISYMIIMDYLNYNDYLWGVATLGLVLSFLFSLIPDMFINLGYKINEKAVKVSISSKAICLILFLGLWSYLVDLYKYLALILFAIAFLCKLYFSIRISREISNSDITFNSIIKKLKEVDIENKSSIYNLLYKSSVGLVIYISFPRVELILNIIASILILIFELNIIRKMKVEINKAYPQKNKEVNNLLCIIMINIFIIIALNMSGIKIFFNCIIIGLNWVIVSDNIFPKTTSFKLFKFFN